MEYLKRVKEFENNNTGKNMPNEVNRFSAKVIFIGFELDYPTQPSKIALEILITPTYRWVADSGFFFCFALKIN